MWPLIDSLRCCSVYGRCSTIWHTLQKHSIWFQTTVTACHVQHMQPLGMRSDSRRPRTGSVAGGAFFCLRGLCGAASPLRYCFSTGYMFSKARYRSSRFLAPAKCYLFAYTLRVRLCSCLLLSESVKA